MLFLNAIPPKTAVKLVVTSPSFADGGDIPFENTQYRSNIFPGLAWSAGPAGTRSYVTLLQDGDSIYRGEVVMQWSAYNVPADLTSLPVGMIDPPAGASKGPNSREPSGGYLGPRTPPGPKRRYHLQVFALDTMLPADPSLTIAQLRTAMTGHVLASGAMTGLGQADSTAPPQPPRGGR